MYELHCGDYTEGELRNVLGNAVERAEELFVNMNEVENGRVRNSIYSSLMFQGVAVGSLEQEDSHAKRLTEKIYSHVEEKLGLKEYGGLENKYIKPEDRRFSSFAAEEMAWKDNLLREGEEEFSNNSGSLNEEEFLRRSESYFNDKLKSLELVEDKVPGIRERKQTMAARNLAKELWSRYERKDNSRVIYGIPEEEVEELLEGL